MLDRIILKSNIKIMFSTLAFFIASPANICFSKTTSNIATCYEYTLRQSISDNGRKSYAVLDRRGNTTSMKVHYLPDDPAQCSGYEVKGNIKRSKHSPGQANLVIGCQDRPNVIYGSHSTDFICGGPFNDVLRGRKSSDFINGRAGNDNIRGGKGDDFLRGGRDNDEIYGDRGQACVLGDRGKRYYDLRRA